MGRRWWSRVARERLLGSAPGSGGELLEVRENVTVVREGCGMLELMEKRGLDNSRYGWRGRGRRGRAWAVIYILIAEIRVPKPEVGVGMEVPGKGDLRCR